MQKEVKRNILRIIDANLNRAKEGLRVCEDIFRFLIQDKNLSSQFKKIRHEVSKIIGYISTDKTELLTTRDIKKDAGKASSVLELKRDGLLDIFFANLQRAEESIRVLEEFCKLLNKKNAIKMKSLRYEIYNTEKKAAKKITAVYNS